MSNNDQPKTPLPKKIGKPATRALALEGYTTLEQVAELRAADLLKLHGVGQKAIGILREELRARGLTFADERDK